MINILSNERRRGPATNWHATETPFETKSRIEGLMNQDPRLTGGFDYTGANEKQNLHAHRYRTDPAYKRKWDAEHGEGGTLNKLFKAGVGATILLCGS